MGRKKDKKIIRILTTVFTCTVVIGLLSITIYAGILKSDDNGSVSVIAADDKADSSDAENTKTSKDTEKPKIKITVDDEKDITIEKTIEVSVTDDSGDENVSIYISQNEYKDYSALSKSGLSPVSASYKVAKNGTYYVYAVDAANNFAKDSIDIKNIDENAPTVTDVSYSKSKCEFTVKDEESGIESVTYYEVGKESDAKETKVENKKKGIYSFTGDEGAKYIIKATDKVGRTRIYSTEDTVSDEMYPCIAAVNKPSGWSSGEITVSFTATDEKDGDDDKSVAKVYFSTCSDYDVSSTKTLIKDNTKKTNNSKDKNKDADTNKDTDIYSFTVKENGKYYIYVEDASGNVTSEPVEINHIDTKTPSVDSVNKTPSSEWANSAVTVSGSVSDKDEYKTVEVSTSGKKSKKETTKTKTEDISGSGVKSVVYSTSENGYSGGDYNTAEYNSDDGTYSFTVPEDAGGKYYIRAIDKMGRVSDSKSVSVNIDTEAPFNVSMEYMNDSDNSYDSGDANQIVFKDSIYIKVHAEDTDSKISKYQYQLVADGEQPDNDKWVDGKSSSDEDVEIEISVEENFAGQVYVRAVDNAGNTSEPCTYTVDNKAVTVVKVEALDVDAGDYTEGSWTNENVVLRVSGAESVSGVRYQYKVDYADKSLTDIEWTDMPESGADSKVNNQLTISEDMNAVVSFRAVFGSDASSKAANSAGEVSFTVKVQKTPPENGSVEIEGEAGAEGWYADACPNIKITEPSAGEYAAQIKTYYKFWNVTAKETEDSAKKVCFDGSNAPSVSEDGNYKLKVWTEDEAGNTCAGDDIIIKEINVDMSAPTDLSIKIGDTSIKAKDDDTVSFSTFYNDTATVTLSAKDSVSGIKSISYQIVSSVSDYRENGDWTDYPSSGIVINPDESFIIYIRAEDNAGHKAIKHSKGIVVDSNAPEINISLPAANANGFYKNSIDITVAVTDPAYSGKTRSIGGSYSGLSKIKYKVYTTDTDANAEGTLLNVSKDKTSGAIYDDSGLIASWSGNISIDGAKFNSNNVFVEITVTDNAGNSYTYTTAQGDIQIDMTNPKISVSYSNNNAKNGYYFNEDRTATIVITERNFNPDDVIISLTNTDGYIPSISGWTKTAGKGNGDDTRWTAAITYDADGDYLFDIGYTDLAGRAAPEADYGNSVAPVEFTIDETLPVIDVSYNNNDAENEFYFKDSRTASVEITEHNFDKELVEFYITATLEGDEISLPDITWSHDGDVHTASIHYSADGDYSFDMEMSDLAGNENEDVYYGNSVAPEEFTVDQTCDNGGNLIIGGVENGQAYPGDVIPSVSFYDINYSHYEIRLYQTAKDQINDDVTYMKGIKSLITEDEKSMYGTFDVFPANDEGKYDDEDDGIYILDVTGYDLAGNECSEKVTFTVNRFGSIYVYDDYLRDLIADGGAYVNEVTEDLLITEYNASRLLEGSLIINITLDGRPIEAEYSSSLVASAGTDIGDGGWYTYNHTISKDNFNGDGVYRISVSSADEANNTPESTTNNSTDADGNPIVDTMMFRVDGTPPEITSITGLENGIINAQSAEIGYSIYDAIGLKSVTVFINGQAAHKIAEFDDINNYSGSFELQESVFAQTVRIVVEDLAGNTIDTDNFGAKDEEGNVIVPEPEYSFNSVATVSTNFFVRWRANPLLFWGTIGGAIILIAGIAMLVIFLRRKMNVDDL